MTRELQKIEEKAAAISNKVQPLIVAVTDEDKYYVVLDDKKFIFSSIIKSLDLLFKMSMVLNLAYTAEAKNFLLFLQRFVCEIKTVYDKMSPLQETLQMAILNLILIHSSILSIKIINTLLLFLQRFVYEIKTMYDKMSPCIYDVMQKLKDFK